LSDALKKKHKKIIGYETHTKRTVHKQSGDAVVGVFFEKNKKSESAKDNSKEQGKKSFHTAIMSSPSKNNKYFAAAGKCVTLVIILL
jgi:hypothetical protein